MTAWSFVLLIGIAFFGIIWGNETREKEKRAAANLLLGFVGLMVVILALFVLGNPANY